MFAFLSPTRGVVGSIVREKELRLREGMRILGGWEGARERGGVGGRLAACRFLCGGFWLIADCGSGAATHWAGQPPTPLLPKPQPPNPAPPGLSEVAYWGSWAVTHWAMLALSGLLCAIAGTYPFPSSSFPLMLLFFWLYAAALVAFAYFLSTLFASSRVAGTATQLLYAVAVVPGFALPIVSP